MEMKELVMKAEKMFVGSLAIVISLLASGCAETTMSARSATEVAGGSAGGLGSAPGGASMATEPASAAADRPFSATNRSTRMSMRAATTRTR
jgi:hypothetical protein